MSLNSDTLRLWPASRTRQQTATLEQPVR